MQRGQSNAPLLAVCRTIERRTRRVQVDHPEALIIRGGVAVFVNAVGAPVIFDHEGVSQIFADSAEPPTLRMQP